MRIIVVILMIVLMVTALGVILAGVIGMGREGGDPMRSNRLMRYRVILQASVIALFLILMTLLRS